jgi:hypothetical protein
MRPGQSGAIPCAAATLHSSCRVTQSAPPAPTLFISASGIPMRLPVRVLALALTLAPPLAAQQARSDTAVKAEPLKRLFRSSAPLQMTITTDLKAFTRTRERGAPLRPATLAYTDSAESGTLTIQIGTRGNFRLQARNCSFPPTRLAFDTTVRRTIFAGQRRLKLVTRCQKNDEYDQYILQEYNLYRLYNLLTPLSFHARLARVTFVDRAGKEDSLSMWAFMIEDDSDMARRNAGRVLDQKGALWDDVDTRTLHTLSLFEFLIGNTDWSVAGLHNIRLVRDAQMNLYPVAYDLDWSGVISARYARPDPKLPIRTVRERLFRGPCLTEAQLAAASQLFIEKKPQIWALYADLPGLKPDNARQALEYFEDFYRILADKRRAKREILETCQPRGN